MSTKQKRMTELDQTRDAVTQFMDAYDKLISQKGEWDNGLSGQIVDATGSDPNAVGYAANDFTGMEGLKKSDFTQVFTALATVTTFIQSADGKKFQDIRK
jgi:hypothetical protein